MVKVLHVFGLQPKIRSDIAEWSPELHKTFSYLTDKKLPQYKEDAMKVLDILFTKTEHNSYFTKIDFGSRKRILQLDNPMLYLVVLTWLRQLQQCFYEYNDVNPGKDWNKHGRYCGVSTKVAQNAPTLSNINMSPVKSERKYVVSELSFFKPNENQKDVVASLEEWAARLLEPDISMILNEARKDKDTSARFSRAKKPTKFSITEYNYKNIAPDDSDDEPTISTSPDKHKNKSNKELLLKISTGLSNILTSASKKKNNTKKLKVGEVSELDSVTETVSSLVAFVNNTIETKFDNLKDMHEFYQQEATHTTVHKKRGHFAINDSDDSESNKSATTSNSESSSNKKPKAKKRK